MKLCMKKYPVPNVSIKSYCIIYKYTYIIFSEEPDPGLNGLGDQNG